MRRTVRRDPATTEWHRHASPTLKWQAGRMTPTDPAGLRMAVTTCTRCGARRFCEMGERMPYACTPTPDYLRSQSDPA